MRTAVGIDPGVHGAIAMIDADGLVLELDDMPVVLTAGGNEIDVCELTWLLTAHHNQKRDLHVVVELQNPRPVQGVSSAFKTGKLYGQLTASLDYCHLPWSTVTPAKWKRAMGVTKDKRSSLLLARRLWPSVDLSLAKHEGRAEALLIAEYGRRSHAG